VAQLYETKVKASKQLFIMRTRGVRRTGRWLSVQRLWTLVADAAHGDSDTLAEGSVRKDTQDKPYWLKIARREMQEGEGWAIQAISRPK
jgi:hypothetical protein